MLNPLLLLAKHTLCTNRVAALLEGGRGLPVLAVLGACHARHLGVQLVDLLQRQTLGLVDEEVDEGDAEEAAGEPDEEDLGL